MLNSIKPSRPSKKDSLETINSMLRSSGEQIDWILDIGVQFHTPELIWAFPKAKHILVEPAEESYQAIRNNYDSAGIDYTLVQAACGKQSGESILNLFDITGLGSVTHTSISSIPQSNNYRAIPVLTIPDLLDKYLANHTRKLLKVDVDGIELQIIQGAGPCLSDFDIVIIECPLSIDNDMFYDRISEVRNCGFAIWDIVDLCYYKQNLSQVDVIFINKTLKSKIKSFNPWHDGEMFDSSQWITFLQQH